MARAYTRIQHIELKGHQLKVIGELNNLRQDLTAVLCSQKCPGELILKAFDLAKQLRDDNHVVISGFHSPIEKAFFDILARGTQPIVMCLARNIDHYRIPVNLQPLLESRRLTIIAPDFPATEHRITQGTAERRNSLIFQISDQVLVVYAQPGGRLEKICTQNLPDKKNVYAIPSERNTHLFEQCVLKWRSI